MPKMRTDDGVELNYHVDDFRDPWNADPQDVILMSHGASRDMRWWAQCVPALARKFRVVRYDIRGHGGSSVPPEGSEWSPQRFSRDALNLVDHLGIDKIHWLGFESGGIWGMVFAGTYRDRIRSLITCNAPAPFHEFHFERMIAKTKEVGFAGYLAETRPNPLPEWASPEQFEWDLAERSKIPNEVAENILIVADTLDLPGVLAGIEVPTLVMVGDRFMQAPVDEQWAMVQQIANARLVVFPNVGIGVQQMMPDRCTDEVLRFLTELDS